MMKNKVFLHIGLGRSGSDFLQKKIFSQISNINYIDRYNSKKFNNYRINLFYNPFFNVKNKTKFKIKKKTLISSENFFNPDYELNLLKYKIKEIHKNPYIILVLREPFSHLVSTYKYSVKNAILWRNLDEIFDFGNTRRARNMSSNVVFYKNFYDYKMLINYLKNNFTNVAIFKFEKIFKSHVSMNNFLSIISKRFKFRHKISFSAKNYNKINSSFSDLELKKKRALNFMKENKLVSKKRIKSSYFNEFYSTKFKKKFISSLNFDYEKLF